MAGRGFGSGVLSVDTRNWIRNRVTGLWDVHHSTSGGSVIKDMSEGGLNGVLGKEEVQYSGGLINPLTGNSRHRVLKPNETCNGTGQLPVNGRCPIPGCGHLPHGLGLGGKMKKHSKPTWMRG